MPIFSSGKSKLNTDFRSTSVPLITDLSVTSESYARLVDVRSPGAFQGGFIPGSYNVSDLACLAAALRSGLFRDLKVYLIADEIEQLNLFEQYGTATELAGPEFLGWFGPGSIEAYQKVNGATGWLEVITADALLIREAAGNTLVLDVYDTLEGPGCRLIHPAALRFEIDELPLAVDGLPVETPLCVTARDSGLATFAASLLWNFGFRHTAIKRG